MESSYFLKSFINFDTGGTEVDEFEILLAYNPAHMYPDTTHAGTGVTTVSQAISLDVSSPAAGELLIKGDYTPGIEEGNVLKITWITLPNISGSGTIRLSAVDLWDSGYKVEAQVVNASYTLSSATAEPTATPTPTPIPEMKPANLKADLELRTSAAWGNTIDHSLFQSRS